jgi:hypothetical protein
MKHIYASLSTPAPRTLIFSAITLISTLIATANHLDQSRWIKVDQGGSRWIKVDQGG